MDAGKLNERIGLLEYRDGRWQSVCVIWGSAKQSGKKNLFSSVGIGAQSVEFITRRRSLSLHNALFWRGRHCFLSDVSDDGRRFLRLTAAIITPKRCVCFRDEITFDERHNPVHTQKELFGFFACVTEKYMGFSRSEPQDSIEETVILVTPKSVKLRMGDIADIEEMGQYHVTVLHTTDEYKNEYEARRKNEGDIYD